MKKSKNTKIADMTKALVIHRAELYQQQITNTKELNEMILILGDMVNKEEDDFTKEYIENEVLPYMKEHKLNYKEV